MRNACKLIIAITFIIACPAYSQLMLKEIKEPGLKVISRSYGPVLGVHRGKYWFGELGAEYHWRKIKLRDPKLYSVGGTFDYNFSNNVMGLKANFWTKQNRVDLTYGTSVTYVTNFDSARVGFTPNVGFRLIGFHLIIGYNWLFIGPKEFKTYNDLFIGLRYFIPSESKIKFKKKKKNNQK